MRRQLAQIHGLTNKMDPEMIFEKRKLFPYQKPRVDPGKNLTRVP